MKKTSICGQKPKAYHLDNHPVQQINSSLKSVISQQMEKKQWGITTLYNTFFEEPSSNLYQLHAKLNQLVMKAYNFKKNVFDLMTMEFGNSIPI